MESLTSEEHRRVKATARLFALVRREGPEAAAVSLEREAAALTALAALVKVMAG